MANKTLKEMTNAELWKLFPILLRPYDSEWPIIYEHEEKLLCEALKDIIITIDHIGSTSVPGLTAKPTIDILMQIKQHADLDALLGVLHSLGYLDNKDRSRPAPHYMFMKGYTTEGFKPPVFHLHVRYPGDYDELYFRNHLRKHPDVCKDYTRLKKKLQKKYKHDRDAYTEAKSTFIKKHTQLERSNKVEKTNEP